MSSQAVFILPVKVHGYRFICRLYRHAGMIEASCEIPIPGEDPVVVRASCSERAVRRAITAVYKTKAAKIMREFIATGDEELIGDVWGDIGSFFTKTIPRESKKMVKSKVFKDMSKGIAAVTNHPAFNAAMVAVNVIPGYGQAISAAMGGMKAASAGLNMLGAAKAGDQAAVNKIRMLNEKAKAGDPRAQKAMGKLKALNRIDPATVTQGALGMAGNLAGKLGGNTQAGKVAQGVAGLGSGIAGAFAKGGNAGDKAMGVAQGALGAASQFMSAFGGEELVGDDDPTVRSAGDYPGFADENGYLEMRRAYARDTAVGDDGEYTCAGVRVKPKDGFHIARRVRYGCPAPLLPGVA